MSAGLWLAVGLFGGIGAISRFVADAIVDERVAGGFPWGTFVVNISGAILLGLLLGISLSGDALLLAGAAALGSYTTFSTWMLEAIRLAEDGELALGLSNVVLSLAAGIAAAEIGRLIGGAL